MVTAKCLPVLYLVITLPTSTPISPAPCRRRLDPGDEGGEQLLGGGEQFLAGAGAVGGQDRVAAGDQPLAGEVRRGDLGEVLLVEEAELEGAVVGHELADGRGAQRGDPPVGVRSGLALPVSRWFMAWIRALVIMPRSPTMTILASPNFSRTTLTISVNAPGSPVLPGNTRTATGRPAGSVSSPYSICSFPFLPSRE